MGWGRTRRGWRRSKRSGQSIETIDVGQVVAGGGTTIPHGGSTADIIVLILNNTGASITMIALPNIEAGTFDGQLLEIVIDDDATQNIILQDAATLVGSGVRLTAASITLNARDTCGFVWNAEAQEWFLGLGGRQANL